MRMPVFSYFAVVGAALLGFIMLSGHALIDTGSPIKTSQLVGLPKVEQRPDSGPSVMTSTFRVENEKVTPQTAEAAYAKDTRAPKQGNAYLSKQRQAKAKDESSPPEHRVAAYSYDAMMDIH